MEKYNVLRAIQETGIIAIVRGTKPDEILKTAKALYEGGIRLIEVTCNTKGYLAMIDKLATEMGDKMFIGAGTVVNPVTAQLVIDAGAKFLLAPNLDRHVVEAAHWNGKLMIPGVATPTEMVEAVRMGIDVVKLFPAGALGAKYLKQVRGPLADLAIIPVGGINLENMPEFLKAGAFAFGVGGELVDNKLINVGNFEALAEKAADYVKLIKDFRAGQN